MTPSEQIMLCLDALAWIGVFWALFAQWLISTERHRATHWFYVWLNVLSFACMAPAAIGRHAYQAVAISGAFVLIVVWGFLCRRRTRDRLLSQTVEFANSLPLPLPDLPRGLRRDPRCVVLRELERDDDYPSLADCSDPVAVVPPRSRQLPRKIPYAC